MENGAGQMERRVVQSIKIGYIYIYLVLYFTLSLNLKIHLKATDLLIFFVFLFSVPFFFLTYFWRNIKFTIKLNFCND